MHPLAQADLVRLRHVELVRAADEFRAAGPVVRRRRRDRLADAHRRRAAADPPTARGDRAMSTLTLSHRDRALLLAAADGRCDVAAHGVPDLRVDGRWFCDQTRAHALLAAGLLVRESARPGAPSAPALLTPSGRQALRA